MLQGGERANQRRALFADPKDPALVLFRGIDFWLTDPKIFLKVPLAPKYTNFEGGARAEKKRDFLVRNFQKVPQNAFFWRRFGCAENLTKTGSF